jgi:hypothetical protein
VINYIIGIAITLFYVGYSIGSLIGYLWVKLDNELDRKMEQATLLEKDIL